MPGKEIFLKLMSDIEENPSSPKSMNVHISIFSHFVEEETSGSLVIFKIPWRWSRSEFLIGGCHRRVKEVFLQKQQSRKWKCFHWRRSERRSLKTNVPKPGQLTADQIKHSDWKIIIIPHIFDCKIDQNLVSVCLQKERCDL